MEKKNRGKMWEEIDDLEKQERQVLCSDDDNELSPESRRRKIKNIKSEKKEFKTDQIKQYQ